jgi:Zn-finger nucleic acid-binding protein
MDCPHCQKNLVTKDYEHISISTCNDCSGIWLDPSQLNQIIARREQQFAPAEIQAVLKAAHPGISPSESAKTLACPICASTMHVDNYDYDSGIIVHVCPEGDGLWFDKGQLQAVEMFMEHWDKEEDAKKKELTAKLTANRLNEEKSVDNKALDALDESSAELTMDDIMDVILRLSNQIKSLF